MQKNKKYLFTATAGAVVAVSLFASDACKQTTEYIQLQRKEQALLAVGGQKMSLQQGLEKSLDCIAAGKTYEMLNLDEKNSSVIGKCFDNEEEYNRYLRTLTVN